MDFIGPTWNKEYSEMKKPAKICLAIICLKIIINNSLEENRHFDVILVSLCASSVAKNQLQLRIIVEVGGWHTINESKKSYDQIPSEKILEIIE